MTLFGFAGYSGSGKTTLIEQLIPLLTTRPAQDIANQAHSSRF
jgi:molybdopterin-guanine dinucleotide biosynthesis protein